MSTRPGSKEISIEEEWERVELPLKIARQHFPHAILSIDTYRAEIAKRAIEEGSSIINDISAGRFDKEMFKTAAYYKTPYILMHMQGNPDTMQQNPQYENVLTEIIDFISLQLF